MSWFKLGFLAFCGGGLLAALVIYFWQYGQQQSSYDSLSPKLVPPPKAEIICGGFSAKACPSGYHCQLESKEPGAAGKCVPVKSFQLFPQASQGYGCPVNDYLDCMSGLPESAKKLCTQEYYQWAKENCPNFKGFND